MNRICKALISLVTVALLVTSPCFAGCKKESVKEIIIKVPRSYAINSVARPEIKNAKTLLEAAGGEFAEAYGKQVKITVSEFEEGEEAKAVTNAFGTGEAADILYDGFTEMSRYIHTGKAVPLDGVLPAETAADLNPTYVGGGGFNGRLYMLPYRASQNILVYNKNLLRGCGLDSYIAEDKLSVSHWSMEDWTTVLDTLAEKLPDGSVPFMMYAKDSQGDGHIMALLRSFGSDLFGEDGYFDIVNDEKAMQAVKWVQSGVAKGWYLPVAYYKTMSDNSSKFKMDELAFYNFSLGSSVYEKVKEEGGLDKYGFVNYPGDICTFSCEGFEVFDNGDGEKISIAKDFIRYFYSTEKWMDCSAGGIPVSGRVTEKYKNDVLLLEAFDRNAVNSVDITRNLANWQGSGNSVRNVFYKEIANLLMITVDGNFVYTAEDCAKSLQDKLNEAIRYGKENSRYHD